MYVTGNILLLLYILSYSMVLLIYVNLNRNQYVKICRQIEPSLMLNISSASLKEDILYRELQS